MAARNKAVTAGRQNGPAARREGRPPWAVFLAILLLLPGCRPGDVAERDSGDATGGFGSAGTRISTRPTLEHPAQTGRELLQRMVAAYQSALAYRDRGVARLSYLHEGRLTVDEAPLAVSFHRQRQLLDVRAYQARATSRQGQLQAIIQDPATNDLDHQVLSRPLAGPLGLATLLDDAVLYETLNGGLCRLPPQLDLLLSPTPWRALLAPEHQITRLPPQDAGDGTCDLVRIATPDGAFVAWIRRSDAVLRRLEYPNNWTAPGFEQVRLEAEFRDASFSSDDLTTYQWPVSPEAKTVSRFVPPPPGLPHPMYGQLSPPFSLETANGETIHRDDLFGRPQVLLWFRRHEACLDALGQVEQVHRRYRTAGGANAPAFAAIAVEPAEVSNDELSRQLGLAGVTMPLWRDMQAAGRDVFQITHLPATVVLDDQGRLQAVHQGTHPELGGLIEQSLAALTQGRNLAEAMVARAKQEQAAYEQDLRAAGAALPETTAEFPAATQPKRLNAQRLWSLGEVVAPGNLTPTPDALLVFSGVRTLAELDFAGQVLHTRPLPLPEGEAVTRALIAEHAGRRIVVAWAVMGERLHVFDDRWELAASYPPLHETPAEQDRRIRDIDVADLDRDGRQEIYVAFSGQHGVHRVDPIQGRVWVNRACPEPLALTTSANQEAPVVWAVSQTGAAYPFAPSGEDHSPRHPYSRALIDLERQPAKDNAHAPGFCGVTLNSLGQPVALGLDPQFGELWNYDLPAGSFGSQVRCVVSGSLWPGDAGHWVFAAPDGSLHLIGFDGRSHEHFHLGHEITGLCLTSGETPLLVVSSPKDISAWRIEP